MHAKRYWSLLFLLQAALAVQAQQVPATTGGAGRQEPPPQAYADCRGRQAGDAVQHATREGVVAATCV
jgi:hypothetical protein